MEKLTAELRRRHQKLLKRIDSYIKENERCKRTPPRNWRLSN
jgi:hypothetical protein